MNEDYFSREGDLLASMRLLVEGAADLFEGDAQALCKLAVDCDMPHASAALDSIGVALTELREHIRTLQAAHMLEAIRQIKA